jgi:putative ABC transport system ATP-binding protein
MMYPDANAELAIELRHLSKVYGSGHTAVRAVDDVSLHVVRGEVIAIMGPSGSGKTTLLQVIGALLRPTSGEVFIAGKNIVALPAKELPRLRVKTFGFIFQTANLLSALTAVQNVELAVNLGGTKGSGARRKAEALLQQLGLGSRLGHRPAELSGGEQQRVAIARALANDPQVLLADEPTANLDSKAGSQVVEMLRRISKEQGRTVVIVSHDLRIRYLADRVLWLEDGHLRVRWAEGATIDPVCLMAVEQAKTPHVAEYAGETFHFCSPECEREFKADASRFLQRAAAVSEEDPWAGDKEKTE